MVVSNTFTTHVLTSRKETSVAYKQHYIARYFQPNRDNVTYNVDLLYLILRVVNNVHPC